MLNKITGCKSRTVPPLYVLTGRVIGESRSLEKSGKAILSAEGFPLGMSQKTYALEFMRSCGVWGRVVAEKRLRCYFFRHRSLFAF